MANHRAERRTASRTASRTDSADSLPAPSTPSVAGKRKAVRSTRASRSAASRYAVAAEVAARGSVRRKAAFALLPSAPTAVGAFALVIAATGAVSIGEGAEATESVLAASTRKPFTHANALTGVSAVESSNPATERRRAVSRDSQREALQDAAAEELQAAAEAQAKERSAALAQLAASAQKHADQLAANAWVLPVAGYRLTATFGQSSGLWANTHTGLDFAAPSGTPVVAVASGQVTSTEYAGSYGNRVILTLEDGTEIWYCHLTSFSASPGDTVVPGAVLGTVGSTGNSTGPHLHLEVRPGAGDAVDPYAALVAHGLKP